MSNTKKIILSGLLLAIPAQSVQPTNRDDHEKIVLGAIITAWGAAIPLIGNNKNGEFDPFVWIFSLTTMWVGNSLMKEGWCSEKIDYDAVIENQRDDTETTNTYSEEQSTTDYVETFPVIVPEEDVPSEDSDEAVVPVESTPEDAFPSPEPIEDFA